jgi:hypothetical protein
MECVYLDLGGGDRWNYRKVRCLAENIRFETRCFTKNIRLGIRKSLENIWFEIRKILDISGIIKIGMDGQAFGRRLPIFCDILYHSH